MSDLHDARIFDWSDISMIVSFPEYLVDWTPICLIAHFSWFVWRQKVWFTPACTSVGQKAVAGWQKEIDCRQHWAVWSLRGRSASIGEVRLRFQHASFRYFTAFSCQNRLRMNGTHMMQCLPSDSGKYAESSGRDLESFTYSQGIIFSWFREVKTFTSQDSATEPNPRIFNHSRSSICPFFSKLRLFFFYGSQVVLFSLSSDHSFLSWGISCLSDLRLFLHQ